MYIILFVLGLSHLCIGCFPFLLVHSASSLTYWPLEEQVLTQESDAVGRAWATFFRRSAELLSVCLFVL